MTALPEVASARVATRFAGWRLAGLRWLWVAVTVYSLVISAAAFTALVSDRSFGALTTVGVFALSPRLAAGLEALGFSRGLIETCDFLFRLVGFVMFAATGAVIFLRASRDWMTGLVSATLITIGATVFAPLTVLALTHPAWASAVQVLGEAEPDSPHFGRSIAGLCVLIFLYLFPDGRFVPRWTRWVAAGVIAHVALWVVFPGSALDVDGWVKPLRWAWITLIPATGLYAQAHRYIADSDSARRRQTQLVLLALATIAAIPPLQVLISPRLSQAMPGLAVVTPRVEALYELVLLLVLGLALLTLPVSIAVSVLRYGLWDIDLFVNRALVYGSLTASLALAYVAAIVLLQEVFASITQGSTVAATLSTLAVAALFRPARDRFQALIDRRFNRRKYDAERTIAEFSLRLRDEVNLDSLETDLLEVVQYTMQPTRVSLWLAPLEEPIHRTREPRL